MDETFAFADMLVVMYFTSVGLYSVELFHLFEQYLADLPLQILGAHTNSKEIKLKKNGILAQSEHFRIRDRIHDMACDRRAETRC